MTKFSLSAFGEQFSRRSGTRQLMDDLGRLKATGNGFLNLGGGNPSRIETLQEWYSNELARLAGQHELDDCFALYEDPAGAHEFRSALADFLRRECHWPVSTENLLCTPGSQASFYMLFNAFAGPTSAGDPQKLLLPQGPEYIGYSGLTYHEDCMVGVPSKWRETSATRFKYFIDFDALEIDRSIGALCISRPTNPTGGLCTDQEIARLRVLARAHQIPLIVDCAYGMPFPGITFADTDFTWGDDVIVCLSLSKLGLPGLRTGIVVAAPAVIDILTSINASMFLSANPLGPKIALGLLSGDSLPKLITNTIRPHYRSRARFALEVCDRYFEGLNYRIHESEGAIFLWVWFKDLAISAQALYERILAHGVLTIPGHSFGPGLREVPAHFQQCLRISYAQPPEAVERGVKIIAEEVRASLR